MSAANVEVECEVRKSIPEKFGGNCALDRNLREFFGWWKVVVGDDA